MTEVKIKIEGMMCGHCQASVTKAITSINGVSGASVNLAAKEATVTFDPNKTTFDAIKAAIVEAGYEV
jgi:copper ion binding protein